MRRRFLRLCLRRSNKICEREKGNGFFISVFVRRVNYSHNRPDNVNFPVLVFSADL